MCIRDSHKGIDPGAIARALLADLRTHSLAEGGSTLTPVSYTPRRHRFCEND